MMKRTVIGATLVTGFAGAVGVSANTTVNLKGSDTLFDLTNAMLTLCPGTAGPYSGGGSGVGQNAMGAGTQTVAPMSRFLNNGACTGALDAGSADGARTSPSVAEGLVIGLDGISILGWNHTFTYAGDAAADAGSGDPVGCNGQVNTNCVGRPEADAGPADPNFLTGAAYNTTITLDAACGGGVYTFNGWRDVLRVLLAGFDHDSNGTAATGAPWQLRECNSCVRQTIANHYGNFFENQCAAAAGEAIGGVACTQIRHVFRRDDFSGTTDTVISLLNLPASTNPELNVTVNTNGTPVSVTNHTGATPFCNAVRPAFVFPATAGGTPGYPFQPTCPYGTDNTWDPTVCVTAVGTTGPCSPTNVANNTCTDTAPTSLVNPANVPANKKKEKVVYRSSMQDNDPIRRLCSAREQVCHHGPGGARSLGLVIPMVDVPEPNVANAAGTDADRYNATACASNRFTTAPSPNMYDAVSQGIKISLTGALCPNGDISPCLVPASATGSSKCIAGILQAPALATSLTGVPLVNPAGPGVAEGREYNQHLYFDGTTGAGVYQTAAFVTPTTPPVAFPVTGAYYRIHTTLSLNADGKTCQQKDMTDQIGCLVEASPCSLGYAGRSATDTNPATDAVKINGQNPLDTCIQGSTALNVPGFKYPLARKLYLNTLVGFQGVSGQELNLAGCETDLAQPSLGNASGGFISNHALASSVFANHFIDVPGGPYCEDFNENMLCPAFATTPNAIACATPKPNFDNFPSSASSTTCGDTHIDKFEDCDCGTTLLPSTDPKCLGSVNGGAYCTVTCRFVQ